VTEVVIRPYEARDRRAVRAICVATGYLGEPATWMWRDEPSFADVFSSYYTDREPASAAVAERDGQVVGYLLGCRDSARATSPAVVVARHVVRRGIALRPGTAGIIWRSAADLAQDLARRRVRPAELTLTDPAYPAHLHVNLLPEARGHGAGARLVRGWLDRLRADGIPGCHLQTMLENTTAVAFFEAMGFRRHGRPLLAPGERTRSGARTHVQRMVIDLGAPGAGAAEASGR
jgi:ribosomal protein S18 acetylase RimI-like enzyme